MSIVEDPLEEWVDEEPRCFLCGEPLTLPAVAWCGAASGKADEPATGSALSQVLAHLEGVQPATIIYFDRDCWWPFVERIAVDMHVLQRRARHD